MGEGYCGFWDCFAVMIAAVVVGAAVGGGITYYLAHKGAPRELPAPAPAGLGRHRRLRGGR